jgi:hypothetical protein
VAHCQPTHPGGADAVAISRQRARGGEQVLALVGRQADSVEGRQQLDIVFRRLHQVREAGAVARDPTAEPGEALA